MSPRLQRRFANHSARVTTLRLGTLRVPDSAASILDVFLRYVSKLYHGSRDSPTTTLQLLGHTVEASPPSRLHTRALRAALSARRTKMGPHVPKRQFHNYFVTHLPSSSLHPDSRSSSGPHHKLPRSASTPHTPSPGSSPAVVPPNMPSRDLTVVRIPLRSAKHHFGAYNSRGSRAHNEDTYQAGTIDMPAFAKRAPMSLVKNQPSRTSGEGTSADSALGDPQIFYFGVFDGHGGSECSEFLRDELHGYIEAAAAAFGLKSSLSGRQNRGFGQEKEEEDSYSSSSEPGSSGESGGSRALGQVGMRSAAEVKDKLGISGDEKDALASKVGEMAPIEGERPVSADVNLAEAVRLEKELVQQYKETVGGYFRRFKPAHFHISQDPGSSGAQVDGVTADSEGDEVVSVESVLTYAFLRADLDFITAQARKPDSDDPYVGDFPLNNDEILGRPHLPPSGHGIGGSVRFKGGSTASVALISTPTPAPFWHPAAQSTLLVAHVGDTRVLLCETATGLARGLTSDHHPSSPSESRRLHRYAESLVTDSFGEERISGLANSRSFGDMRGKRIGVSAEPDVVRVELGPAEYSFLVLATDGVTGTLSDQEIVDVIKEARTPEQGAREVVEYANEISSDGDNATCLVVRLGGWERRSEGGLGSLGTKEIRDTRRAEAQDPRRTHR
ncbi:hypothetical protein VTK73DRAFT_8601 [Phialemonium thermophilum]|uniref:PPM-type phosphatase domain-containing protein n=1 Tax=Phialemonium thermophilum TaxID=223376 RepID=A0ABR3XPJ6_9PEZI